MNKKDIKKPQNLFNSDFIMKESLKYVDSTRQKMRNDFPFKYWILNQDVFINITAIMWIIWQAWVLSVILAQPVPSTTENNFAFYIETLFWKIGTRLNSVGANADIIGIKYLLTSFVFIGYSILLFIFSIYTLFVVNKYINEIQKSIIINKQKKWNIKIIIFIVFTNLAALYGFIMFFWILLSLFFVPSAFASQGFSTLIYEIPPVNQINNEYNFNLSWSGYVLLISNGVNLSLLIILYLYYLRQRFIGYKFFFSFEKKEWKKIDFVGEKTSMKELKNLKKLNKARKKSFQAVNNDDLIIELKNLNKYFITNNLKFHALKDINLKIHEGEFVIILGPSGSGKSTLLNIISGVDRPTKGEIVVANHNILNMNSAQLTKFRRDYIGYIFQQYSLLPNLTVKENIMIGYYLGLGQKQKIDKQAYKLAMKKANVSERPRIFLERLKAIVTEGTEKNRIVNEMISLLGLEVHANKYPSQLSGGQQQRVAIARAMVKQPSILFGDEPTAAIDEEMSKQILELFCLINQTTKTTIVMVTHNPLIAELGTRVIKVVNGQIISNVEQIPKTVNELNWNMHSNLKKDVQKVLKPTNNSNLINNLDPNILDPKIDSNIVA